jgi:hypothetical protein
LPAEDELPPFDDRYFEIEVAKLHGGWWHWSRLNRCEQAELMAHEMHKNMRAHYEWDKQRANPTREGQPSAEQPKVVAPWEALAQRFFNKPK